MSPAARRVLTDMSMAVRLPMSEQQTYSAISTLADWRACDAELDANGWVIAAEPWKISPEGLAALDATGGTQ